MEILRVLDSCAQSFTFPMLDNGYVYLGATRLTLFRSTADWAMVMNPHNESRFFNPIAEGAWQDDEVLELVARDPKPALVRGEPFAVPPREGRTEFPNSADRAFALA